MTQATTAIEAPKKRSLKLRTIGFVALGFCALGYAGFVASVFAIKADMIAMTTGLAIAGVFAIVGEAGLWIGAASLGLSFYARRRDRVARFFGRVKSAFSSKS